MEKAKIDETEFRESVVFFFRCFVVFSPREVYAAQLSAIEGGESDTQCPRLDL